MEEVDVAFFVEVALLEVLIEADLRVETLLGENAGAFIKTDLAEIPLVLLLQMFPQHRNALEYLLLAAAIRETLNLHKL